MVVKDYNLEEFRKRYNASSDFLIRIRDKEIEGKDVEDIVYYNGIKAFVVNHKKSKDNNITLDLPENIYKLNRSNISNIVGIKKDITKLKDLLDAIYEVRDKMKNYVCVHLSTIKLKIGSAYYKGKNYLEVQENVKNILDKINSELEKYDLKIDSEKIMAGFTEKCTQALEKFLTKHPELAKDVVNFTNVYEKINYLYKYHQDVMKKINFNVSVDTNLQINKEIKEDLEIEKVFILNTIFKYNLTYDKSSGFSIPEFKYKMLEEETEKLTDDLDKFDKAIKLAVLNYEEATGEELEKKYQHQFMLNPNVLTKFANMGITNLIPFEEEYYINEGKEEDNNGRLDCIFINPQEMKVYLIELKVNDSVIGAENKDEHGINKHLEDINNLCSNKEKLQQFLDKLLKRFNNTQNKLYGKEYNFDLNKVKVYFYTIIAVTPNVQDNAEKVIKKLEALYNVDKTLALLNPENASVTIADCEMKILFDIWAKEINADDFMSYESFKNLIKKFKQK